MMRKIFLVPCLIFLAGCVAVAQSDAAHNMQLNEAPGILNRAVALQQEGETESAVVEYRRYLQLQPRSITAHSNLGVALARLGRLEEAAAEYQKALALDPRNAAVLLNLGIALYKTAEMSKAAEEILQVVKLQPANDNARLLLADCYLRMGDYRKVIALLEPLRATHQDDQAFLYLLGSALLKDDQVEQGQILINRILREQNSAAGRLLMGTAYVIGRDYPSALKEFEKAIALDPNLPTVHSAYGRILLVHGERQKALAAFQQEIANDPHDFEANLFLGMMLKQDQKYAEALPFLERALKVRPDEPNARYYIAGSYFALGKINEAQNVLEALVAQSPAFVEAHVTLATVYYRNKRKEDGDRERALVRKLNDERQVKNYEAQKKATESGVYNELLLKEAAPKQVEVPDTPR